MRAAAGRADLVVTTAHHLARELDPDGRLGVQVVGPGVDLEGLGAVGPPTGPLEVLVLGALVPWKAPPDLSRFLLSPMPGLLVDVTVVAGQEVHAGERLAVVEAMKMENALVAQRNGRVARVVAQTGDSLAVDQVILEFEQ